MTDCWDPADYEDDYETHERDELARDDFQPILDDDPEPRRYGCPDCGAEDHCCCACGSDTADTL